MHHNKVDINQTRTPVWHEHWYIPPVCTQSLFTYLQKETPFMVNNIHWIDTFSFNDSEAEVLISELQVNEAG